MTTLNRRAYKRAFAQYLRRGTPIEETLEALSPGGDALFTKADEHPTKYYIWHTQGDDRVRPSHRANDGKIFAWDDPPPTGHPGEAYGCRCWTEPYVPIKYEHATQILASRIPEGPERWEPEDFARFFFLGGGNEIRLWQIGHLVDVIHRAEEIIYPNVNEQIVANTRVFEEGDVPYKFTNSYNFRPVSWPHGKATVSGEFAGNAIRDGAYYLISGTMKYGYYDLFTDPADIREKLQGTSNPHAAYGWWRWATDATGTPFPIVDAWETKVRIAALVDREGSIFQHRLLT